MKKKILALVLCVLICVGATSSLANVYIKGDITPYVIAPCPYGVHDMISRGGGTLYKNGVQVFDGGYSFQCTKCYEILVSDYNPGGYAGWLGTYGTAAMDEMVAAGWVDLDVKSTGYYYSNSVPFPGYTFRYN